MLISNPTNESANPFIGVVVDLKDQQLRLEDLIAEGNKDLVHFWFAHLNILFLFIILGWITIEGGFGYVFRARDTRTTKLFALKRLIASDSESKAEIENEISMLSRVQSHHNIMQFFCWDKVKPNIYFLLW